MVPACIEFPATVCQSSCCHSDELPERSAYKSAKIRITMAAIDPTAEPEADAEGNLPSVPRSTLKIIKASGEVDSDDEDDEDALERLLAGGDDEEDSEDDEEPNGGPSDPSKSKKARQAAAIQKLIEATQEEGSDDEMQDADVEANGVKAKKGKGKASDEDDEEEEDDDSDDEDDLNVEDYVVCTLDTERVSSPPRFPLHCP